VAVSLTRIVSAIDMMAEEDARRPTKRTRHESGCCSKSDAQGELDLARHDRIRAETAVELGKQHIRRGETDKAIKAFDEAADLAQIGEAYLWSAKVWLLSNARHGMTVVAQPLFFYL